MEGLWQATFSYVNLIPTILLIMVLLYWFMVILGALDVGFIDVEIEAEVEMEVEVAAEGDVDAGGGGASWFMEFLSWFNLGKIPFMVFVTGVTLPLWLICINVNHYLGIDTWIISFALFIPAVIVSMFIAKFLTWPLIGLFRRLDAEDAESIDPVGRPCTLTLMATRDQLGQAKISVDGTTNLINVKTNKVESIQKGEKALVVSKSKDGSCYIIAPYEEV